MRECRRGPATPWTALESWQRVINLNLTGTWLGMKYQIPAMLKNGRGGAIVNMTSAASLQVFAGYPVYFASKWGVVGNHESCCQGVRRRWRSRERDRARLNRNADIQHFCRQYADFEGRLRETEADRTNLEGRGGRCHCNMALFGWASYVTGAVVKVDGGMTL